MTLSLSASVSPLCPSYKVVVKIRVNIGEELRTEPGTQLAFKDW